MPQRLTADEIKERLMKDPKMPNVKDKRLKKKSAEPSANNAEKSDRVTRSSDAAAENVGSFYFIDYYFFTGTK